MNRVDHVILILQANQREISSFKTTRQIIMEKLPQISDLMNTMLLVRTAQECYRFNIWYQNDLKF